MFDSMKLNQTKLPLSNFTKQNFQRNYSYKQIVQLTLKHEKNCKQMRHHSCKVQLTGTHEK